MSNARTIPNLRTRNVTESNAYVLLPRAVRNPKPRPAAVREIPVTKWDRLDQCELRAGDRAFELAAAILVRSD